MINRYKELLPSEILNDSCNIAIEFSLAHKTSELIDDIGFSGKNILVVCDPATHAALAKRVTKELGGNELMLSEHSYADEATVKHIRSHDYDALIAVGSGTINDLCKYASYLDNKPYAVFPTAPSMNGYFSANASITVAGHKQTLKAHLPKGIFCDLGVLSSAPRRLILSGLGDSLCRPTAQADWLLSHMVLGTHYDPLPFNLLAPYEQELFAHSAKLGSGDPEVMGLLIRTLLISGAGMVIAGGSYPASQAEHLIAHTMEMKHGKTLAHTYHGEQIGVTTLAMTKIQQRLLKNNFSLPNETHAKEHIAEYFGADLTPSITQAYEKKAKLLEKREEINERLRNENAAIREAIASITLPQSLLHNVLQEAGAKASATDLGWNEHDLNAAIMHAKYIRDRFTFLDLLEQ